MTPYDRLWDPHGPETPRWVIAVAVLIILLGASAAGFILISNGGGKSATVAARSVDPAAPSKSRRFPPRVPRHSLAPVTAGTHRPGGHANLLAGGAASSFDSLAASLPAQIGLAVAPLGPGSIREFGNLREGHAWSSIKVPILVTLMRDVGNRGLTAEERAWATSAITASDNTAAADLFQQLEKLHGGLSRASLAVQEVLAMSGDRSTTVATQQPPPGAVSTYGQTEWSLAGSVQFYRSLAQGCLLDGTATKYVEGLMEDVIPEQRWGLGEAAFPAGWRVAMKGGWGPEGSADGPYLVRQSGIINDGVSGLAVTMIAQDESGSYGAGAEDLTRMAEWLAKHLRGLGSLRSRRCSE
jgi:hypothetical protein